MGRFASRIALWFLVWGVAAGAGAAQPSIRFAEPVDLALKGGAAEFDAYGRRFSLNLSGNERMLQKLDPPKSTSAPAKLAPKGSA